MENQQVMNTVEANKQNANYLVGNNELILSRILNFLKFLELKSCRLVNTKWFYVSQPIFNKSAVVKLRCDYKQGTINIFLSEFNDPPFSNTFDGISIEFNTPDFDWYDPPITNFLKSYGNKLKYIKLQVSHRIGMPFQFFIMKNILSELVPELEHLCVEFEGYYLTSKSDNDIDLIQLQESLGIRLTNLKKLEWSIKCERPPGTEIVAILRDMINSSPNLKSVLTEGSLFISEVFNGVSEETISGLDEIIIRPGTCDHDLSPFLDTLTKLGEQNLQLSSFVISANERSKILTFDDIFENEEESNCYVSLLTFLNTQRNSLRKLQLHFPMNVSTTNHNAIPELYKLPKLQFLKLSDSVISALFKNRNDIWTRIFPNLRSLFVIYSAFEDIKVIPHFLISCEKCPSIQYLRLHIELQFAEYVDDDWEFFHRSAFSLYETLLQKFPNMKTFQIYQKQFKILHSFLGSNENYACGSMI